MNEKHSVQDIIAQLKRERDTLDSVISRLERLLIPTPKSPCVPDYTPITKRIMKAFQDHPVGAAFSAKQLGGLVGENPKRVAKLLYDLRRRGKLTSPVRGKWMRPMPKE